MSDTAARIKVYAGAVIALCVIALILLWPAGRKNAVALHDLNETQDWFNQVVDEVALRDAAEARYLELEQRCSTELKEIPVRADPHGLMQSILVGIDALPLGERNLSRGSNVAHPDAQSLGLRIQTSGDFRHVYALLQHVESLPRLVVIRELAVTAGGEIGDGSVTATISLDAFHMHSDTNNRSNDDHSVSGMR
ncbi:MAG: type 4a pilus biogenesis protein PilO [Planctomycetota bacterium]